MSEEALWRKAIADQVRANCTPSSEAYEKGGDVLVYTVCDWIENPPEWSGFATPASDMPRYSILELSSASRVILRWNDPPMSGGPGWWSQVAAVSGHGWADATKLLADLTKAAN